MIRRLLRDDRGSMVTTLALALPAVIGFVGLGIDVMMAQTLRDRLQGAVDQAAVAAASQPDPAKRNLTARRVFDANIAGGEAMERARITQIVLDDVNYTVDVSGELVVDTYFSRLFGQNTWTVRATGSAVTATGMIEVAMSLDVTGSMAEIISGTTTRIAALRSAAAELVNAVIPPGPATGRTSIAITPFNEVVNIGTTAARRAWVNATTLTSSALSGQPWNGCVVERNSTDLLQDTPPTGANLFRSLQSTRDSRGRRVLDYPGACSTSQLTAPTTDRTVLLNAINALTPNGGTRVDVGAVWAWRMLSPRWRGLLDSTTLPRDYSSRVRKYAVIMTDGENAPNAFVTAAQADSILLATCTRMKNAGITVYTIGFGLNATTNNLLRSCASSAGTFYDADTSTELSAAFRAIGRDIARTRLRR